MRRPLLAAVALLFGAAQPAFGQSGGTAGAWFESGDSGLRVDLELLNDAGVIRLPITQWPLPRAALEYAIGNAKDHVATNRAVQLALERVRARVAQRRQDARGLHFQARATLGEEGRLRSFDTLGREGNELTAGAAYSSDRLSVTLRATAVADADDGQRLRLDGSEATLRVGNWLLSANTLDRFWGPAHDSSTVLSNNARPMPTLMIERAEAREFDSRLLNWLGPWRMSFGVSRMESERQDIDAPLFMAWRVTVMPWRKFELGFTRTAQFCGKTLPCDSDSIWAMLIGNDNPGFDATPENEPGNQMAGFDIRWHSPIGTLPYTIYAQLIGEDESSYLPVKFLHQFGVEAWKPLGDGGIMQGWVEYIDTTCEANQHPPTFNCVYNQGKFNVEGYRYRGHSIGHTADRDAEGASAGLTWTQPSGAMWKLTGRSMRLNRDGGFDANNTVAHVFTRYQSLELGWRGHWRGLAIGADVGAESAEIDGAERQVDPVGFLSVTYDFGP